MCHIHTLTLTLSWTVWEKVLFSRTPLTMWHVVVEVRCCDFISTTMRMQTYTACKSFVDLHVDIISYCKLLHLERSIRIGLKFNTNASLSTLHFYSYINLYFSLKYKFIYYKSILYLNSFFILFRSRARK